MRWGLGGGGRFGRLTYSHIKRSYDDKTMENGTELQNKIVRHDQQKFVLFDSRVETIKFYAWSGRFQRAIQVGDIILWALRTRTHTEPCKNTLTFVALQCSRKNQKLSSSCLTKIYRVSRFCIDIVTRLLSLEDGASFVKSNPKIVSREGRCDSTLRTPKTHFGTRPLYIAFAHV